ncbi:hypothetical protein ABID31_000268 [Chryseobacterium flavum]|nr:hypothetical protein [Chryseobacterium flavum]
MILTIGCTTYCGFNAFTGTQIQSYDLYRQEVQNWKASSFTVSKIITPAG